MALFHNALQDLHTLGARASSTAPPKYNYSPSFPAAIVFVILYTVVFSSNIIQFFWYRCWFWWPMLCAIAMELVGYITRAISIKHLNDDPSFTVMTVFLLVSPAVMAAACYMAFGRTVLWVVPAEYHSTRYLWLPARRITPLFVSFDVLSFFIQVIGGATVATAKSTSRANTGKNIVVIGLALQLFTFGFFVVASTRFTLLLRMKRDQWRTPNQTRWPVLLLWINGSGILILVRSTYRLLEFALGVDSYLWDYEAFFYCLDALPVFVVVAGFAFVHPGSYLPYLRLRRKKQKFSPNAGRGLLARLSRGDKEAFGVAMDVRNDNADTGV